MVTFALCSTFVCPTEIIAFSDRVEEFRSINCEVVACSTDSHFSHLAWSVLHPSSLPRPVSVDLTSAVLQGEPAS